MAEEQVKDRRRGADTDKGRQETARRDTGRGDADREARARDRPRADEDDRARRPDADTENRARRPEADGEEDRAPRRDADGEDRGRSQDADADGEDRGRRRDTDGDGREPGGRAQPRLGARDALRLAGREFQALTGKSPESVVSIESDGDQGWRVGLEVLEMERIPNTNDLLACYELELDGDGELVGYRRLRRYVRGDQDEGG